MQFKTIILSIAIIIGGIIPASAQSNRHHKAHDRMQAKSVTSIERQASKTLLEHEIELREQAVSHENDKLIADIIKEARSHLGKPYVWGAHGPKAFDCTGFTSYVYKQFGYTVAQGPAQINYGTPVKKEDMRPGDIMFFTSPRSGSRMGHAGMVYSVDPETGAVKFIHASPKGFAIQDFNANYQRRFIAVHRIVKDEK